MDIYEKLGIKTGINACGTVTRLGGSRLSPEVSQAMTDASKSFIPMHEFHRKAGQYVADLLGVEACCITCGAAAGLAISGAACMTNGELSKVLQLPDTEDMPDEILMLKSHRILYDQALRLSGAKIIEVDTSSVAAPDLLEADTSSVAAPDLLDADTCNSAALSAAPSTIKAVISKQTAAFVYVAENERVPGSIPLPELIPILKRHEVPILVDAAAELPPVENIKNYLEMGADLVVFSGGKEIRGPQSSGIIVGKKELIEACHANCCPNYSIGRSMKISRETVAGLVAAVEIFASKDYERQLDSWADMSGRICASLNERNDVKVRTGHPTKPGVQPVIILRVYIKPLNMTAIKLQEKLQSAQTPIYVDIDADEIVLNPQCLEPEEVEPLIKILNSTLDNADA